MFWQEDEDKTLPWQVPDDILDVSFSINCKALPQDHGWALAQAIGAILPWFADNPFSGIHTIHVAESANGWMRPEDGSQQLLIPSRRTRMMIRIPKTHLNETLTLTGKTFEINNYPLTIGKGKEKPLNNASVIFSRYVLSAPEETEDQFMQRIAAEIKTVSDFKVKKMMCGKSHTINTPQGIQLTRHLMIADLDSEASIRIQQTGLGEGRTYGCGLFLPHKGIKTLKPTE